jgi:nicotinamide riboside kinase
MAKGIKTGYMGKNSRLTKIVVTGPESTGKTTLSEVLALKLNGALIPEYARSYVEGLRRHYNYDDLEVIARHQVDQEKLLSETTEKDILVLDTWLILTKVWFDVVYGIVPQWIEDYIASADIDLFLVCRPDLPWIPDTVRENGGEMRNILFDRYCREINHYGFRYEIVEGEGDDRWLNAMRLVQGHNLL